MTTREWQDVILDRGLDEMLAAAGCPCTVAVALATADQRRGPLSGWVQASLGAGIMLRTSQAEHVAAGRSLVEASELTGGGDVRFVLATLARFEGEMSDVDELYAHA